MGHCAHVEIAGGADAGGRWATRTAPAPERWVEHLGTSGVVLAVDLATRVPLAKNTTMIAFVPQIEDFVAVEERLFVLYDGATAINDPATAVLVLDQLQRLRTRRFEPNPFDERYAGCC